MEEKKSSEEQREEMKQSFIDDLKKRKAFAEEVKSKSLLSKLEHEMEKLMGLGQEDDTQTWIDKLNIKSAVAESAFDSQITHETLTSSDSLPENQENLDTTNSKTLGDHEQPLSKNEETGSLKDTSSRNDKTLF